MSLQNRIASCDVCGTTESEHLFGTGWPGWAIVNGIGAVEPTPDEPIANKHTECYLCPVCREKVSNFIDQMQEWERNTGFLKEVKP